MVSRNRPPPSLSRPIGWSQNSGPFSGHPCVSPSLLPQSGLQGLRAGIYGLASDPKFRAWKATLARGRGSVFLIPWHDPR